MENEALELLKILERTNADNPNRWNVTSANLSTYISIKFILDNNIVIDEKIIEGWVLENIGRRHNLDQSLGLFTSFGNNMPTGYLKFMDIFGYQELSMGTKKYKVVEVKKGDCIFPDAITQFLDYVDWVVENIAEGDYKLVEGAIIAKEFNTDCITFVKNCNATGRGRKIQLIKFDYVPARYDHLNITRVV